MQFTCIRWQIKAAGVANPMYGLSVNDRRRWAKPEEGAWPMEAVPRERRRGGKRSSGAVERVERLCKLFDQERE
jgi:hypothetical protein